ncbi:hypothetical protein ABPG74_003767 [Tetrahymena malaccensis]
MKSIFLIIFSLVQFASFLINVNGVGCPFWQVAVQNDIMQIQKIILIKSNPQKEYEDTAAIVYTPFSIGIFNLQTNQKYELANKQKQVTFYEIDKDDRQVLKISRLNTLDSNGRIIDWNPLNGLIQKTIQIPKNIKISQGSCLNSQETLVFTWNSTHIFLIDFSQLEILDKSVWVQQIRFQTQYAQCTNDKLNRQFLLADYQGGIYSFDIQTQNLMLLFKINQFKTLLSIYPTKNQIAVSYQSDNNQDYIASYRNSQLSFEKQINQTSTQVLVNNEEDQIIVVGQQNLFQVWQMQQNKLVYSANFQSMICDFRDSNQTGVDSKIDFLFGSINQNNEISIVSEKYVFAYSLDQQKPIIFKNQNFGINFIQSFILQNKIILASDQTVSIIDKITQQFIYVTNYLINTATNYDVILQIEIDVNLNRVIFINFSGVIEYWSYFDNQFETYLAFMRSNSKFLINKSLNKLVQYVISYQGQGLQNVIGIYNYREGSFIQFIKNEYNTDRISGFTLLQDQTNGFLIGFNNSTLQYNIYRFQKDNNHSQIFNGTLIQNQDINQYIQSVFLLEKQQQILLQFQNQLFLFNYFYTDGLYNNPIPIQDFQNPILYFYFNQFTLNLYVIQDNYIKMYSYSQNIFLVTNSIPIQVSNNLAYIQLIEEQSTLIIFTQAQIIFCYYQSQQTQIFNLQNQPILQYACDNSKSILIAINNNQYLYVIDISKASLQYSLMLDTNQIQMLNIYTDQNLVIISFKNGKSIIFNYITYTYQGNLNYKQSQVQNLDTLHNNLFLMSSTKLLSKALTSFGLIEQISYQKIISNYFDIISGLAFILADRVYIYNLLQQEYLPPFPSVDIQNSQFIFSIPSKDFIFIQFVSLNQNKISIYKLSTYEYVGDLSYIPKQCQSIISMVYDQNLNRLFSGCYPWNSLVWDLNQNFKLIKVIKYFCPISIVFDIETETIIFTLYSWFSYTVDYYSLQEKGKIEGIYGDFDHIRGLQMTWDQNGDIRIYNSNSNQLAFQHAHEGWVNQVIIDSTNMILTSIGNDLTIKIWSYSSLNNLKLMQQQTLQGQLNIQILDRDNNYLFVGDSNGYIYQLTYPDLVLMNTIQVCNQLIDTLQIDFNHNILIYGSQGASLFGFYNLIDFIMPNSYSESFRQLGILSVLNIDQGVIFHQTQTLVQKWNFSTQQIKYGFYAESQNFQYEPQSQFLILQGQDQTVAFIRRDQLTFFNIKTFEVINTQKLNCLRNIQLFSYLVCSIMNQLTIISISDYSFFQAIILNENQSIINLQSIDNKYSFFATTTQGEVICYSINQQKNQFQQQFYSKILDKAIANYLFTSQNNYYYILVSCFKGQIGLLQFTYQLQIEKQKQLQFQGTKSHAHVMVQYTDKIFMKRVSDLYLGIYSLDELKQLQQISSPCMGYTYKLDMNQTLGIILQHCVGSYLIHSFQNFQYIAYGRFTNKIKLPDVYTSNINQILFINKKYFIDVYPSQILIYQIDYNQAKVIMLGDLLGLNIGKVADYFIFDTSINTYIQLVFYSQSVLGRIQIPIYGENVCSEQIAYDQFTQTLFQIEIIFQQIQNYYLIQSFIIQLIISQETVLQQLPNSSFSQITEILITSEKNVDSKTDIQQAYITENLFQSFSGYNLIRFENLQLESILISNDILIFSVQNITSFQLSNIRLISQVLFSFQISQVQFVSFNELYLLDANFISNQTQSLFNFTSVININFSQIFIKQSYFSQIIIFYFKDDINANDDSQILISNLIFENSSIFYEQNYQNSAPVLIQNFNSVKLSKFNINDNKGSSTPFIKSSIISNFILDDVLFQNNKDIMLLEYKDVQAQSQNKLLITQQILQDTINIKNILIQGIQIIKQSIFSIVSIRSSQIYLNSSSAVNNFANFTNQNSLFELYAEQIHINNVTFNENQDFQNILMIQNTQQGSIKTMVVSNNLVMAALLISQSNIQIYNSLIKQNESKFAKQQNSVFTITQNSFVEINQLEFDSNQSNNGGSLFVSSSQLIISQSSFKRDKSLINGGSIYSYNSQLTIQQSSFQQCTSSIGGCIFAQEGNLNISQLHSQNNTATQLGGFLYISQIDEFILKDIDVSNTQSFGDGGSLYINESIGVKSAIINSIFSNNQAKGSGGSILSDNSNFQVIQCKFQGNSAGIGGAIRYLVLKPDFMLNLKNKIKDSCNTYENNECYNNRALIFGNSIASYPSTASIVPSKQFSVHSEFPNFSFSNFQSGLSNFDLVIVFFDEFHNRINQIDFENQTITNQLSEELIQEISQYSCRVYLQQVNSQLQNQTIKLDGAQFTQYQYQSNEQVGCFMNGLKITGIPSQQATMNLQLYGMKTANKSHIFTDITDIKINIQFRSCQTGEYYNKICQNCFLQECNQCLNGTYSLVYPTEDKKIECKSCDLSKSQSCYSDQIILRQNYWRINNHSDLIYECNLISNSCNGDSEKGYCKEGFIGALCSSCDTYGKVWGQSYQFDNYSIKNGVQCVKCSQYPSILLKELFLFIIITIYLIVLIIQSQDSNCKVCLIRILQSLDLLYVGVSSFLSDNQVISKIFINQFQILSTLKYSLRINISQIFSNFLTIPQSASQPINVFTYSFDCLLNQIPINIPIQYKRFINISLVLPLIFIISFFIFVYLILQGIQCFIPKQYFFYKTKYLRLNVLISALVVLTYIASQNIYQAALENIFCDKYSNIYFMKSQMDQICYTQEHYYYIIFLIGPILFLVSIAYPFTILIILYRNRFKLFDSKQKSINLIRRYGYLFKGFKKNRWWWEILKTWYKFLITLMATLYRSQPLPQILCIIFLQMIYLYLLMKYQPYQHYKINVLEKRSVIYTLLIYQISIVYLYNEEGLLSVFSQIGLIILLILLFGKFMILLLLIIYHYLINQFFLTGRLSLSFIEVHSRVNFYAFGKIGCLNSIRKYLRSHLQGQKCKFWIKDYLFNNFWGLYNILYVENYDPYRVFSKQTTISLSNCKKLSLNNSNYSPIILQIEKDLSISNSPQNSDYFQFNNNSKNSFKNLNLQGGMLSPKSNQSPNNSKCYLQAVNSEKDNQPACIIFQKGNSFKQIKKQKSSFLNSECQSIFSPKRNSVNNQNIFKFLQQEQDNQKSPISKMVRSPIQQISQSKQKFVKQQSGQPKLNNNSKKIKKIRQLESNSQVPIININSSVNQKTFSPLNSNHLKNPQSINIQTEKD